MKNPKCPICKKPMSRMEEETKNMVEIIKNNILFYSCVEHHTEGIFRFISESGHEDHRLTLPE